MDSVRIKKRMSILSKQIEDYDTTLLNIENAQKEMDKLVIELFAAIEDEKNNPWVETPDVLFIKSKDAPRLMIYPFVRDYYGQPHSRKEYNTVAKKLVGISSGTSCPYKFVSDHKHSKGTGHWCASFRVRERQLKEYRSACISYLGEQMNPGARIVFDYTTDDASEEAEDYIVCEKCYAVIGSSHICPVCNHVNQIEQ